MMNFARFGQTLRPLPGAAVMNQTDAFITGVDVGGTHSSLLEGVRKENVKVKEVVTHFSNKVENLIDKQRNEYIQAYESHMQEVQKELHSLREKVADIANDETKNEKTASLKVNQKKYKEEALKLESDSDEILKKIKKLLRKIYTVEKSRDWMLRRLRKAKQEYNQLIKERNRLFEDWDSHTMSLSLASMSNASSYTLDLKESLKMAAVTAQRMGTNDPATQAAMKIQTDYRVDRNEGSGILPAISPHFGSTKLNKSMKPWDKLNVTKPASLQPPQPAAAEVTKSYSLPVLQPANKHLSKSLSGPALLATFANSVNNHGKNKNRKRGEGSTTSVPVAEQESELVDEKLALARLIALRARRQEVREFLQNCSKSVHRGPWCRVKARPLDQLLEACQAKVQHAAQGGKFRTEELLQMVCELTVHPETYVALAEIFDSFAPVPLNYMSDDEIEAADVVKPAHLAGVDLIADELLDRFGDHDFDFSLDSSEQPSDVAVDFRDRLNEILQPGGAAADPAAVADGELQESPQSSSLNRVLGGALDHAPTAAGAAGVPQKVTTRALHLRKVVGGGGLLDKDLTAYFMQEDSARRLSNMGFYEKDNFMDFD